MAHANNSPRRGPAKGGRTPFSPPLRKRRLSRFCAPLCPLRIANPIRLELFHMSRRLALLASAALLLTGCGRAPEPAVDPALAAEISRIQAIDNHAHPVRNVAGDRQFDALPVDNMEAQSDPVAMRPNAPALREAAQAFKNK